jgi:hypothetical protein
MNTHVGHGINVCEYGVVHSQCRCMNTTTHWIQCPTPERCQEETGVDPNYVPKHRKNMSNGRREVKIDL